MNRIFLRLWNSPTYTTWGSFFSKSLSLFAVTPLILTHFESQEIAVWYLFASIISLGHLMDLGFAPTFIRLTAYVAGGARDLRDFRKPVDQVRKNIQWDIMEKLYPNMGLIYTVLSLVLFIILVTLGSQSVSKQINLADENDKIWIAWTIICIGLPINFYGKKYDSVLKGMNYIALINRWNVLFNIISGLTLFLVLVLKGSILELVIANQFWSIINTFRNRYLKNRIEENRFKKFKFIGWDREIFLSSFAPGWRTAIMILGSQGVLQLSGVIYAQYIEGVYLATYLLSLRLLSISSEFSWAPFYSKIPVYAKLRARNELGELFRLSSDGIQKSLIVFIAGGTILGVTAPHLLKFIGSNVNFVDSKLWIIMFSAFFFERHHAMHAQIYNTTNHVPFYIPVTLTGSVNVLLTLFLIPKIGIWSGPVAHLFSNMLVNNWWNVKLSLKSLEIKFTPYFKHIFFLPLVIFLISIIIIYYA